MPHDTRHVPAARDLYIEIMFFLPVNVDVPMERLPWMNWLMMLLIILAYAAQQAWPEWSWQFILGADGMHQIGSGSFSFMFETIHIDESPWSWIGHMFMHADLLHLIGNLAFMWVFGNATCAKLGNLWYAPLWIMAGLFFDGGLIGASGAIMGVVGFYAAFYVRNDVTILWCVFFRFGTFAISSCWVILFYFGLDVYNAVRGASDGVAHIAHVGGLLFGFGVAISLLARGRLTANRWERTLLDMLRKPPPPEPIVARDALQQHLFTLDADGETHRKLAAEMLANARHDPDELARLVSADGRSWTSLAAWKHANTMTTRAS